MKPAPAVAERVHDAVRPSGDRPEEPCLLCVGEEGLVFDETF
jgi:hypothetical protein